MAKIATGNNPADNFWRHGNMLGAIELETGIITRVLRGTGVEMSLNETHPDTKRPIVGTLMPQWDALARLVISAAENLPGKRAELTRIEADLADSSKNVRSTAKFIERPEDAA